MVGQVLEYEEIRAIIVEILLDENSYLYVNQVPQYQLLLQETLRRIDQKNLSPQDGSFVSSPMRSPNSELIRDAFWDLFRQGFITIGANNSNENWPFFRLSHLGKQELKVNEPLRFHSVENFLKLIKASAPDLSEITEKFLAEAVRAFYSGCLLSACVMLGVAAESEFNFLLSVAKKSRDHSNLFLKIKESEPIRKQALSFQHALDGIKKTLEPWNKFENIESNLNHIQSVIRVFRNDAGHPTADNVPDRLKVYVYLQLFIPFAEQVYELRRELSK